MPRFPENKRQRYLSPEELAWVAAAVPDVRPHDLRHTFVSWGAAQGLSLPTLGALVGHSEAATTQRYAHLSQSPPRAAVEQIGAALAAAMGQAVHGA